jgi:hypothetical protein
LLAPGKWIASAVATAGAPQAIAEGTTWFRRRGRTRHVSQVCGPGKGPAHPAGRVAPRYFGRRIGSIRTTAPRCGALIISVLEMAIPTWVTDAGLSP